MTCEDCNKQITGNIIYRLNGDNLCKECMDKRPSLRKKNPPSGYGFIAGKDKLWEFTTQHLGKKVEIRSKSQWNRFMKKHGLVQLMNSDLKKMEQPVKPELKPNAEHRRELSKIMLQNIQERRRVVMR